MAATLVEVTQEDIDSREDALALAISRATGREVTGIGFFGGPPDAFFADGTKIRLPVECERFLYAHDIDGDPKPFSFELEIPVAQRRREERR